MKTSTVWPSSEDEQEQEQCAEDEDGVFESGGYVSCGGYLIQCHAFDTLLCPENATATKSSHGRLFIFFPVSGVSKEK